MNEIDAEKLFGRSSYPILTEYEFYRSISMAVFNSAEEWLTTKAELEAVRKALEE